MTSFPANGNITRQLEHRDNDFFSSEWKHHWGRHLEHRDNLQPQETSLGSWNTETITFPPQETWNTETKVSSPTTEIINSLKHRENTSTPATKKIKRQLNDKKGLLFQPQEPSPGQDFFQRCCYITVDSAMAASQTDFALTSSPFIRKPILCRL
jgi:hypothetical protein